MGRKVNFYFPRPIPSFFQNITCMEEAYHHESSYSYTPDRGDQIIVRYHETPRFGVYNVEFHDGKHDCYICGYGNIPYLNEVAANPMIKEIHLPYISNRFGGSSYKDIAMGSRQHTTTELRQKIRINGFHNDYECMEAMEKWPNRIVEVIDRV